MQKCMFFACFSCGHRNELKHASAMPHASATCNFIWPCGATSISNMQSLRVWIHMHSQHASNMHFYIYFWVSSCSWYKVINPTHVLQKIPSERGGGDGTESCQNVQHIIHVATLDTEGDPVSMKIHWDICGFHQNLTRYDTSPRTLIHVSGTWPVHHRHRLVDV